MTHLMILSLHYQANLPTIAPIAFFGLTLVFSLGVLAVGVVLYRRGE